MALQSLAASFTVAVLAQGTSWAVAVTQAFLLPGSILVARAVGALYMVCPRCSMCAVQALSLPYQLKVEVGLLGHAGLFFCLVRFSLRARCAHFTWFVQGAVCALFKPFRCLFNKQALGSQ